MVPIFLQPQGPGAGLLTGMQDPDPPQGGVHSGGIDPGNPQGVLYTLHQGIDIRETRVGSPLVVELGKGLGVTALAADPDSLGLPYKANFQDAIRGAGHPITLRARPEGETARGMILHSLS